MPLQNTRWLTVTNIALGVFVVFCLLLIAVETICDAIAKLRRHLGYEAELDQDMDRMFGPHPEMEEPRPGSLPRFCACMKRVREQLKKGGLATAQFFQHAIHYTGHPRRH